MYNDSDFGDSLDNDIPVVANCQYQFTKRIN